MHAEIQGQVAKCAFLSGWMFVNGWVALPGFHPQQDQIQPGVLAHFSC